MDAYKRFQQLLRRDFFPLLRTSGFKGSGSTLRRVEGVFVDVVNVQGSQYGGSCCVNLGVQLTFLTTEGGRSVSDPLKLKEYECVFRNRLHEKRSSDQWWEYGKSDEEAEANVASITTLFQHRGLEFFNRFRPFPDVFEKITPEEIDTADFSSFPTPTCELVAALTLARIMDHLGNREKCRQFAKVGLHHLGHAIELKAELESLRDKT